MKEKEIVLFQVYELEKEINEILKISKDVVKNYWLTLLFESIAEEKTKLEKVREGLFQKYGELVEKDGQSFYQLLEKDSNEQTNPKYIEFMNEWVTFLNQKKTIEYTPIKLSSLEGLSLDFVPVNLYKFIDKE